jgi:regulator of protease activity HflC (stomatin/prohibitin superfamily)
MSSYGYGKEKSGGGFIAGGIGVLVVLAIFLALFWNFGMYTRVQAGNACVLLAHGKVIGTAGPGKHFDPPWGTTYECRETRPQNGEVGEHEGKEDYARTPIVTQTKDGMQVSMTAQIRYITPSESLAALYTDGARTQEKVWNDIVQKEVEKAMRGVANVTPVRSLYLEGRADAGKAMSEALQAGLNRWGITLDTFTLTGVEPPQEYRDAISNQQAEVEKQQLAVAQQETILVQNENNVLTQQGVNQVAVEQAQGQADAQIALANGEAESNRIISDSTTAEILQLAYYDALSKTSWAILSPGDVQPTLPVQEPAATPAA